MTSDGPKTLEFNCRFGDPETQVLLPLLADHTDLVQVMLACTNGCLDSINVSFKNTSAVTVVAASGGYPGSYQCGFEITLPDSTLSMLNFILKVFD